MASAQASGVTRPISLSRGGSDIVCLQRLYNFTGGAGLEKTLDAEMTYAEKKGDKLIHFSLRADTVFQEVSRAKGPKGHTSKSMCAPPRHCLVFPQLAITLKNVYHKPLLWPTVGMFLDPA